MSDAEQLPLLAAGRGPGDRERDQHRQEPDHLADRVHQQHPRVQPLPLGVAPHLRARLRRRVRRQVRLGHVASPSTASALRVSSSTSRRATSLSSPAISQCAGRRGGGHGHRGQPEQPRDRALGVVDGLDPRHRRDPALPRPPAGLGVDRGVGHLPAVHQVAPLRHDRDVGRAAGRTASANAHHGRSMPSMRPAATTRTASGTTPSTTAVVGHISRARGLTRWLGSRSGDGGLGSMSRERTVRCGRSVSP